MKRWQPDRLLAGFESLELEFPADYEGAVVATLVRLPTPNAPRGAVLYVHGFSEYFFQRHMAERFAAEGYAFYALDLRKYGRSLRPHQHPNFCKHVSEYYADIDAALEVIGGDVLLAGHSTGGLVAAAIGRYYPFLNDAHALKPDYTRALRTEWEFEAALKPDYGFPIYYGWLGAVSDAFEKVHQGLAIQCPVLSMHSDAADIVLDWRHIARWSRILGPSVTVLAFPGGWHDLILSPGRIREEVFSQLFAWAERAVALPA